MPNENVFHLGDIRRSIINLLVQFIDKKAFGLCEKFFISRCITAEYSIWQEDEFFFVDLWLIHLLNEMINIMFIKPESYRDIYK